MCSVRSLSPSLIADLNMSMTLMWAIEEFGNLSSVIRLTRSVNMVDLRMAAHRWLSRDFPNKVAKNSRASSRILPNILSVPP